MKISIAEKPIPTISFCDLDIGDCFTLANLDSYYLRIADVKGQSNTINAIEIGSWMSHSFHPFREVIRVESTIIIEK